MADKLKAASSMRPEFIDETLGDACVPLTTH
jgi:hypothetical protein